MLGGGASRIAFGGRCVIGGVVGDVVVGIEGWDGVLGSELRGGEVQD